MTKSGRKTAKMARFAAKIAEKFCTDPQLSGTNLLRLGSPDANQVADPRRTHARRKRDVFGRKICRKTSKNTENERGKNG